MRRLICATLVAASMLAPVAAFTSKKDGYRVDFPAEKVNTSQEKAWRVSLLEKPADKAIYVVAVREQKNVGRYQVLKQLEKEEDFPLHKRMRMREIKLGGVPGLELQGMSADGVPVTMRVYAGPKRSYFVAAGGYDMAAQRRFVESFRLL